MLIGRSRSTSYLEFALAAVTAMPGALVSGQHYLYITTMSPGASRVVLVVKNHPANAGDIRDVGPIPGLGRFPGRGNGNPLQYICLENPMDRRA